MANKIKLAYFGTPIFSVELLKKIVEEGRETFDVLFVVTQPDRPVGRKQILTPSPVKTYAQEHGIQVYEHIDEKLIDEIKKCDIALVFAFGEILKSDLLRASKHGFWNVHPSALPLFRGPSPVVFPLLLGEKESAVSLIQMDEKMDHGPIIGQEFLAISPEILHNELLTKMAQMSYYILFESVKKIDTDSLELTVQDESKKTFTQLLLRESGYIKLETIVALLKNEKISPDALPAVYKKFLEKNTETSFEIPNGTILLWNMYRGLTPWPGVWTEIEVNNEKKRLKIIEMSHNNGEPIITKVQVEGKNPMPFNPDVFHAVGEKSRQ
jgi:methionyl-tRNA formyltransferase